MVDNSYNTHILSEENLFTDKIEPIISNEVATEGIKYLIPKGIGTVTSSWNEDGGEINTQKLNYLICLPYALVDIISATLLAESIMDD